MTGSSDDGESGGSIDLRIAHGPVHGMGTQVHLVHAVQQGQAVESEGHGDRTVEAPEVDIQYLRVGRVDQVPRRIADRVGDDEVIDGPSGHDLGVKRDDVVGTNRRGGVTVDVQCEAVEPDAADRCSRIHDRCRVVGRRHLGVRQWFIDVEIFILAVEVSPVDGGCLHRVAVGDHASVVEDHQLVADRRGKVGVVGDEQHRHALFAEGAEPVEALLLEGLVAHGQDLIDQEDLGLDVDGKIVVALFGAPKFLNTEERAHYRATTAQRASERGAVGMIVLFTPALAERIPVPDPFAFMVERRKNDSGMSWVQADGVAFSNAPNINGSALLNPQLSERLFENQPATWADILAAEQSDDGVIKGFDMNMTARITTKSVHHDTTSPNVIGMLPGTDPVLKNEFVVLTAHLDHEGIKPTPEEGDDEIFNGAMDNATGTASVLEVAHLLAHNPPKRSVLFVALTAEEKGLVGSDYNARNPTVPAEQVVADINLDMPILTYPFSDVVAFGGERSTMYPIVEAAVAKAGLTLIPDPQPEQGFFVRSDQYSYVKQGVPAVYLDLGFGNGGEEAQTAFQKDHYHKVSDEADLVDYEQLRRFAQVNFEIANGVANMEERPLWKKDDFFARIFGGTMEE